MRFTIDKEQFLKSLNAASKAVPSKSASPYLTNLKLELNEKGLEILGSNGDISIKATVPYMVNDREIIRNVGLGSTLVNSRILTEIVRNVEGGELSVEVIDEAVMKIDDSRSSFKLNCIKAEEYPDIDLERSGTEIKISCYAFASLVDQSAFAASNKDVRPILTALHLEAENGRLVATATDSARLARKEITIDDNTRFACNVPAKTVSDIVHMFDNAKEVIVSVSPKKILFDFDNVIVASRLIPGEYPVTRSIIPTVFNYTLEANAAELLSAMNRVRILSADTEPVVTITMREEEVEVSAKSDTNGSALEKISTYQYAGERLSVSFNSQFVIDAIKALKCEDVTICFMGEMKPFVVKNPKDNSVVELITPMRTF
jgi:DNA polymerase-3 subunit beta